MMPRTLSPRERRLLAVMILMAVVALLWFAIVGPVLDGFAERRERRQQLTQLYAHNVRVIGGIPRARRRAERQREQAGAFVLVAANPDQGREALRIRLQQAIEAAGGAFREGADAESPAGTVRVRATARVSQAQLSLVLNRLQNAPPFLIVGSLSIAADGALVATGPSPLDVQIEAVMPFRAGRAR